MQCVYVCAHTHKHTKRQTHPLIADRQTNKTQCLCHAMPHTHYLCLHLNWKELNRCVCVCVLYSPIHAHPYTRSHTQKQWKRTKHRSHLNQCSICQLQPPPIILLFVWLHKRISNIHNAHFPISLALFLSLYAFCSGLMVKIPFCFRKHSSLCTTQSVFDIWYVPSQHRHHPRSSCVCVRVRTVKHYWIGGSERVRMTEI